MDYLKNKMFPSYGAVNNTYSSLPQEEVDSKKSTHDNRPIVQVVPNTKGSLSSLKSQVSLDLTSKQSLEQQDPGTMVASKISLPFKKDII